jgi:ubiquinone/menaquinone biosynthesis C-methylase UbiE
MLNPFRRGSDPQPLVVGMTGIKMGERFAQIGCAHGGRLGAVAAKVGLSGRAVAFVPDEASAARARKGASDAGALVEVETAPPARLPIGAEEFDLVVIDDTGGFLASMAADAREATLREARRILRGGGRLLVIASGPRAGLTALLSRAPATTAFDPAPALRAGGFSAVRTLAEREGLIFVEGIKRREPSAAKSG